MKTFKGETNDIGRGDRAEDRRWIRLNLLTRSASSIGTEAFEVVGPVHHYIVDLIPPATVFFHVGCGSEERVQGK